MKFIKYYANTTEFKRFSEKYIPMLDDYELFVKSTEKPSEGKDSTGKASSYKNELISILINITNVFNVELDLNNYQNIMNYLEEFRKHPDFKEFNAKGQGDGFPNAAINHFDLFLNNNLFRNDNYNDNIKKSSKTPSKFQYDPLYSEVKEGKRKKYYTSKYERKPALRNSAIEIHGYICNACDINLEDIYGNLAKGFIEVHHIKPLYSLEEEITVDPKRDLVPLCPNCHRMIHRKRDKIMSVSELKEVINSNDN